MKPKLIQDGPNWYCKGANWNTKGNIIVEHGFSAISAYKLWLKRCDRFYRSIT